MLPISVTLERNTGPDRLTIPYIAHVECRSIINRGPEFQIPIRAAYVGMKKTLSVEVAGFRLMTEHLNTVPALVERLIEGVARSARIPHYVFIARDAGTVFPVYTIGDEVLAPTPNGPLFQHVELAVVRQRLSDYLHDIKVLGANGRTDKFHVRGVHRHSLQLIRPKFYLKKRVAGETDFWTPVFGSVDSPRIYAYAANARREATIDSGREVLVLRDLVANVLMDDGRLADSYDLRPDRMFAETWDELSSTLDKLDDDLVINGVTLPLYKDKAGSVIGLEIRPNEERYSLFLGNDRDDVAERARHDFSRRGIGL